MSRDENGNAAPSRSLNYGEFNYAAVVIGLPGYGKTTLQAQMIRQHLDETGGIVIAHDPVGQFRRLGCQYYENVAAWRAAAAKAANENAPMPRGASIADMNSDAVTELVLELGEKMNSAENAAVPILYPSDEASLREGSGSTYMGKLDKRMFALRRHLGLGPVLNLQEPGQLVSTFYRYLTDAFLFKQTADRAVQLDNLLFLERGELVEAGITTLERHDYIHVRIGDGIVDEGL